MIRKEIERILANKLIDRLGKLEIVSVDIIKEILLEMYANLISDKDPIFPDLTNITNGSVPDYRLINEALNAISIKLENLFNGINVNNSTLSTLWKTIESYDRLESSALSALESNLEAIDSSNDKPTISFNSIPNELQSYKNAEIFAGSLSLDRKSISATGFSSLIKQARLVDPAGNVYHTSDSKYIAAGNPNPVWGGTVHNVPIGDNYVNIVVRPNDEFDASDIHIKAVDVDNINYNWNWSLDPLPEPGCKILFDLQINSDLAQPFTFVKVALTHDNNVKLSTKYAIKSETGADNRDAISGKCRDVKLTTGMISMVEFDSVLSRQITITFEIDIDNTFSEFYPRVYKHAVNRHTYALRDYGVET